MFTYLVFLYLLINSSVNGIEFGKCPSYTVQQNFTVKQYLGKWYQHASINTNFQGSGNCIFAIYSTTNKSNEISVHNERKLISTNETSFIDGTAVLENPSSGEGKLIVTFPTKFWFKISGPYWVLSTDYSTYSIVYSCTSWFWVLHSNTYWILTRDQIISNTTLNTIEKVLETKNLKYSDFEKSSVGC